MNLHQIILTSILLTTLTSVSIAQEQAPEFQVRVGAGIGLYTTSTTTSITTVSPPLIDVDKDSAFVTFLPLSFRYQFHKRFNAGFDINAGHYLYSDEDSKKGLSNKIRMFGIGAEFNAVSTEKTRLYIGASLYKNKLLTRDDNLDVSGGLTEEAEYKGTALRLNLGAIFFINNGPVGIKIQAGWDSHYYELNKFSVDGRAADLSNIKQNLSAWGIEMNAGVVVRIKN